MNLVIGPGVMGIFAFLGALDAIGLENIEEISGSSAGALLGMCVCLGKTVEEMKEFLFGINLKELSKFNITSLILKFGLIQHEPAKIVWREFLGGDPKFKDLKKKLYVTAFCINKMETEYFSVDSSPDMSVLDAAFMSISVPFLFESVKYKTFTYIDGCTRESLPVMAFLNKDPKDVLVLCKENHKKHISEIKTMKDFIMAIIQIAGQISDSIGVFKNKISIDFSEYDVFNFSMEYEEKARLYLLGYQTAKIHLGSAM
jgi:predicted acylesterase/phospholipase RssA